MKMGICVVTATLHCFTFYRVYTFMKLVDIWHMMLTYLHLYKKCVLSGDTPIKHGNKN